MIRMMRVASRAIISAKAAVIRWFVKKSQLHRTLRTALIINSQKIVLNFVAVSSVFRRIVLMRRLNVVASWGSLFQRIKAEAVVSMNMMFQAIGKASFGGVMAGFMRVVSYHCMPEEEKALPIRATIMVTRGMRK